jgi:hypothetical protein
MRTERTLARIEFSVKRPACFPCRELRPCCPSVIESNVDRLHFHGVCTENPRSKLK